MWTEVQPDDKRVKYAKHLERASPHFARLDVESGCTKTKHILIFAQ